ncbi:hypothetical protein CEXT_565741 [Caerostris extrusa]|uniref:Uncharacterized protein n=1 Tax=Caerostris extrusa TaxID=172846 RepID=A0AAV4QG69_CAEEX|nr:hypothetical protein CEXT_565741 [Caerostris extrusa]
MTWGMQRKRRMPFYVCIGGFKRVSRKEGWRSPFYEDLPNDHFRKEPTSTPSEINEKSFLEGGLAVTVLWGLTKRSFRKEPTSTPSEINEKVEG